MILKSNDTVFELTAVGYQFPDLEREPYDSDWLNIKINVKTPQGAWTATDPSLLTWELADIADWLESIAEGKPVSLEKRFIEPDIRFLLVGIAPKRLRVYFELETRPSWAHANAAEMSELWAEFDVKTEELKAAAASLHEDLKIFPMRTGHNGYGRADRAGI